MSEQTTQQIGDAGRQLCSSALLAAVEESCRVEMANIQKSLAEKTCVQDYAYIAMVTVTIFESLAKRAVEKAANDKLTDGGHKTHE